MIRSLVLLFSTLVIQAAAHGYLSSPPPRGIQKAAYQIDDLKSPNRKGLCRGEPAGQITTVQPGQTLHLGLTITAPHVGPCTVTLLDTNLSNESAPFAQKMNCAAPGGPGFWDVKLPTGVSGRKVLRWTWEGQHVSPSEPYEQCIDLDFGGGGGGGGGGNGDDGGVNGYQNPAPAPAPPVRPPTQTPPMPTTQPTTPTQPTTQPRPTPTKKRQAVRRRRRRHVPRKTTPKRSLCHHGAYKCVSQGKFAVCNWGKWISMACATGTQCMPVANSIVCG